MQVYGTSWRTIWQDPDCSERVLVIDQACLPHRFAVIAIDSAAAMARAIRDMHVRGAGLIGASAAWGMYLALCGDVPADWRSHLTAAGHTLVATRPTARNLAWAVEKQLAWAMTAPDLAKARKALETGAQTIADADAAACQAIGKHGLELIRTIARQKPAGQPVNILTHCNAGWLAFVDHGSALAPVYAAQAAGIPVHVWVDETRPRNQGASLTAWELAGSGVSHTLIADNAGGHLMQHGMVDMVITGADRVSRNGDVANKIGTYLKALAAKDNDIPFYVALPSSTFDFAIANGLADIPIEERSGEELRWCSGKLPDGTLAAVQICPDASPAGNWGFDVTPCRLVTALISERGICAPADLAELYPEARGG